MRRAYNPSGWIAPSVNFSFRMDTPAGLGALAITVNPPPVTAPATRAVWNSGVLQDLLRLEVGQGAFEPVPDFEAQRPVGDEEEEHDAIVLLRAPDSPGLGDPLRVLLQDLVLGQGGKDGDQDLRPLRLLERLELAVDRGRGAGRKHPRPVRDPPGRLLGNRPPFGRCPAGDRSAGSGQPEQRDAGGKDDKRPPSPKRGEARALAEIATAGRRRQRT